MRRRAPFFGPSPWKITPTFSRPSTVRAFHAARQRSVNPKSQDLPVDSFHRRPDEIDSKPPLKPVTHTGEFRDGSSRAIRATGTRASARLQDSRGRAGRAARRSIRTLRPGLGRRRAQDSSGALGHLRRRLSGSAPTISIVREFLALVVRCHQMQGDLAAALAASDEGLPLDRDDAETHFRKPGSAAKSASRPRPKLAGEVS